MPNALFLSFAVQGDGVFVFMALLSAIRESRPGAEMVLPAVSIGLQGVRQR